MAQTDYVSLVSNAFFTGMGSALGHYFVYRMLLRHFDKDREKEKEKEKEKKEGGEKSDGVKVPMSELRPQTYKRRIGPMYGLMPEMRKR